MQFLVHLSHKLTLKVLTFVSLLCTLYYLLLFTEIVSLSNRKRIPIIDTDTEWINDDDISYSTFRAPETNNKSSNVTTTEGLSKKEITISLYKTKPGDKWTKSKWKEEIFTSQQCKILNSIPTKRFTSNLFSLPCRIAPDEKYYNTSDAIVFHSRDFHRFVLPYTNRNEKQIWIYFQQESPIYTYPNLKKYSNVFNWTMTYRRDSDVEHAYGHVVPRSSGENSTDLDFNPSTVTNKTGVVAWIVSHCRPKSNRQVLVRELSKYLTIDIYGKCGHPCPAADCYTYVASKYKMYISFENSLCTGYITEKFFNALSYNMLPIVYGGGTTGTEQDYSTIAPKGSYIDSRSFNSTKELADYILYLHRNDTEFLKFFEWKKKYQVVPLNKQNYWCSLCQKIYEHVNIIPPKVKWYKDLWTWWKYVEVDNQSIVRGTNETSLSSLESNLTKKTRACISPPNKLILGTSE